MGDSKCKYYSSTNADCVCGQGSDGFRGICSDGYHSDCQYPEAVRSENLVLSQVEIGDTVSFRHGDDYSIGEVIAISEDSITVSFRADKQEKTLSRDGVRLQWKKEVCEMEA